jgi:hydrophobe/amphiphile efflux-3 (HAE3) family protein
VFTGRPRLLPLALALLACALTFGALAIAGAPLTIASIAVLPVLVGLAVDYAIQFQSRVAEARTDGVDAGGGEDEGDAAAAVEAGAAAGGGTLVTAGAASAAAMLALLLSPVPMVRGFGLLLVAGVAIALACTFTVGAAALSLPRRPRRTPSPSRAGASRIWASVTAAWRGAGELVRENALTRGFTRVALVASIRRPARVLSVGLVLAVAGWALDTQTSVETDITKLVPQSMASLQGLNTLERTTGVAGEIDLLVSGRNVTAPATIEWMSRYQSRVLARFGYNAQRGCGRARLCPAFSLPDLFATPAGTKGKPRLSDAEVRALLAVIPPYFSQDVVTSDHTAATLAFGIPVMSLTEQQQLIERMRATLHPPKGVSASLVGLPVLAAHSGTQVADPWRRLGTLLVSLALVALVLLIAFRGDRRRALVPLVPIALATGWSGLVQFAVRVPLNPMSVMLGSLVIAISTEFSVLLSERFRHELAGTDGSGRRDAVTALRRSYARTGAAIGASGVTAIVGFGVLALSDIRMLRDFGIVTVIDLTVSLLGVLVALPAVLVLAERREPASLRVRRHGPRWRARRSHEPA